MSGKEPTKNQDRGQVIHSFLPRGLGSSNTSISKSGGLWVTCSYQWLP